MESVLVNELQQVINEKNITRLCHFTKSSKALSILSSEDGIVAVDFLPKDIYDPNDTKRLDGRKSYINCSIQYPNYWYFRRVKDNDPLFKDWVILLIDTEVILDNTTEFCCVNAAKGCGRYIKKGVEAFKEMFSNQIDGRRRNANMLSCCPTDDQAEVLVYRNISRKDIIGVVVKDEVQAHREKVKWNTLGQIPDIDIIIGPDLFSEECSKSIRRGETPKEYIYNGGE
ncbi:DarT ssDNA thymidine ADP-ribosyltransferase family protein [Clostridium saccharoperbutylacetonicum]|uniref:DarT ssDNA thymidine ADP-ribosyltransferase family protein n=1 Tax=Clostridium saccharoperbutylacetonicum TaxID=36745 RepID=UPI0039E9A84C